MRNAFGVLALGLALACGAANLRAADIYVDNDDGAPGYTDNGNFRSSSNTTAGYNGGGYRFSAGGTTASTATWTPTIPTDGYYAVYAIFRRSADRPLAAPYTVNHADGSNTTNIDQTGDFSGDLGEELLGVFRFTAGTTGTVTLSNTTTTGVNFIADTIRFVSLTGPEITDVHTVPLYPQASQSFDIAARIGGLGAVQSASVSFSASPSGQTGSVDAFDDGLHNDGAAGDGVFGATVGAFPDAETVSCTFHATDEFSITTDATPFVVVVGHVPSFQVNINEVLASNGGSRFDLDFGDSGDWIELSNAGPDIADLTGYAISDDAGTPSKWSFPAGITIPAGGYLLVWCDDHDIVDNEIHTNFKLSASGEHVVLYNKTTAQVVDEVVYPSLATDQSYSRFPDGTGAFASTIINTPLAANLLGERGAAPTFSLPSGLYAAPISVIVTAPGSTEIRYTVDGSAPTATSTLYTAPIGVSATTGLRATAFYAAVNPSTPASASYFYTTVADRTIPVMNLVIDPKDLNDPTTGLFTNFNQHGDAWERPGHAMFMNPDGSQMHESGVGVRINGGTSRGAAKKALRLYMRTSYGNPSWSLPWLERTTAPSFDNLVLRSNNNDGILDTVTAELNEVVFFRDQLARDFHGDTGALGVDGFFFALYINGQYWGLYNACERVTNSYMESKAGGAAWDIMKGTWNSTVKYNTEPIDGDVVAWNAFLAWQNTVDISTPQGLADLKSQLDYPAYLKYMAMNFAMQNEDWPQNNWVATRRRDDITAKWFFHENDAEWSVGLRPQGYQIDNLNWTFGQNYMNSHNNTVAPLSKLLNGNDFDPKRINDPGNNPAVNGIMDNPQGRADFISAVEEMLNFELVPAIAVPKVTAYQTKIQSEVPRESARWLTAGKAATFNANWPSAVDRMRTFFTNRPAFVRTLLQTRFAISGTRTITFNKTGSGNGRMQIYGRTVTLPWTGIFFDGSVLNLAAVPDDGSAFTGWSGVISQPDTALPYTVTTGADATATLDFGLAAQEILQNDVIFNEYWVNDNSTTHTIGAIDGDWLELLVVKDGVDLRGWRVTNNQTKTQQSATDDGDGSLIFPQLASIADLRSGTIILVVTSANLANAAAFPADDLDASDRRLVFYRGNGNLDDTTDAGFGIGNGNEALTLLAPGPTAAFADDIGVDVIAEGATVTPATFFATTGGPVTWPNPFSGIGNDDGAIFTNEASGGWNNDNGTAGASDGVAGPGGWIVDPSSALSGDAVGSVDILTPGAPNTGQTIPQTVVIAGDDWVIY
ncbi:hypothetical protein BH09SUM1_BH09SUM1_11530 [soil metagenome]